MLKDKGGNYEKKTMDSTVSDFLWYDVESGHLDVRSDRIY